MPTPCEALATAAEVQELREQLNQLLGEKEDGTKVSLFTKGQGSTTVLAGGALTLLGMAKVNAPKVVIDIIKSTPTPQGFAVDAAKGQVLHELLKANGTKVPAAALNDTTKLAGQGATGAATAAQVGGTAAGSLMLLATLVQIAGTLALNKATVDILGNRIDVESAGTAAALDQQNNTMLRLYQKHQGDFAAVNAQLEANDQIAAQNRQTFAILKSDLQQNTLEIGTFNSKLAAAQTQINDLIAQNNSHVAKINQLEDDLVTVKADLTAQVTTVSNQLAEAVKIIESQQADIIKLNERVAVYEARATAIEEKIAQFETESSQNRADWTELRAEIDLIKELNPSLISERPSIDELNYDKVTYYETAEQTYERLLEEHNKPADQKKPWSQITQYELSSELAERFARQELQAKKHGFASTAGLTQTAAAQTGILELADKLGDPTLEPSTIPKEITKEDLENDPDTFKERFAAFIERIIPNVSPKLLEDLNTTIDSRFDAISGLIGTAVIPRLNDLTQSVSEPKIAKAVEVGLCNSLNNPSACPITPGNPNPTQGLKGQQDWLNGLLNGADLAQGTVMAKRSTELIRQSITVLTVFRKLLSLLIRLGKLLRLIKSYK
jgi:predicted  nucleic acid-binding Zn-ribbon protein